MNRFDNVLGSEYDLFRLAVPHHDEFQRALGTTVQEHAKAQAGPIRVVELGMGTGVTTRVLLADDRISVIGIDNELKTLERAKQVLREYGTRAQFVENDLLGALSAMPAKSTDVVASAYTIHNLPEAYRVELYREVARVLKSGGLFVNADKYALDDDVAHCASLAAQLEAFAVFAALGRDDLAREWTAHYLEDDKMRMYEGKTKLELAELGFVGARTVYRKGMEAVVITAKS